MKKPLSVTEITRAVKTVLENSFPYAVEVEGEISNFRPHYSGHAYFTLKDTFSQLSCVMWRSRVEQLAKPIENGQQVICSGTLSVYEKSGRYQLNALNLRPVGQGDLQTRLEILKQKLWQEGLFDESRKRRLPAYPSRVGLISSPTGAAIRDLISVAQRRNPAIELILRPAQVQGAKAAPDLIQALEEFNRWGQVDVIIMGRGGGSLEDLWAFNDEALARAIYHSRIPVVSAVGHEIDVSLSDLVADHRSPTPSAAAEEVIPPLADMQAQLYYYQEKTQYLMQQRLRQLQQRLQGLQSHHALQRPRYLLEQKQAQVEQIQKQLQQHFGLLLTRKHHHLKQLQEQLHALNPLQVLERGFVYLEQEGRPVTRRQALKSGPAKLHFADGPLSIHLEIKHEEKNEL